MTELSTEAEVKDIRWELVAQRAAYEGRYKPRPPMAELTRVERLLAHYASRRPQRHTQYVAEHHPGGDGMFQPDENGDMAFSGEADELWLADWPVRVHVLQGTDTATAVRLIRMLADWIERDGVWRIDDNPLDCDPLDGDNPLYAAMVEEGQTP